VTPTNAASLITDIANDNVDAFVWEAVVRPTTVDSNWKVILSNVNTSWTSEGYAISISTSDRWHMVDRASDKNAPWVGRNVDVNDWVHVVYLKHGASTGNIYLLLNGIPTFALAGGAEATWPTNYTIGNYGDAPGDTYDWDGDLASIAIWATAPVVADVFDRVEAFADDDQTYVEDAGASPGRGRGPGGTPGPPSIPSPPGQGGIPPGQVKKGKRSYRGLKGILLKQR
jgi:hypothetical protein